MGFGAVRDAAGAGGIGGLLAAELVPAGGGEADTYLAFCDANGNIGQLIATDDGSLKAQYEYGPYGGTLRAAGDAADINPFRLSTKYTDSETGLLYYGLRYYNPDTARWVSRDPIGERGGINVFVFVLNHPSDLWDAKGTVAGKFDPIAGRRGYYRLIPAVEEMVLNRCEIVILAGHTSLMPGKMTVAEKDAGCAFGEMYGCFTGGGEAHVSDDVIVVIPIFETPGIPGAPGKPTDFIDDDELRDLADRAFEAAKGTAEGMCGKPCCCEFVSIRTEAVFTEKEFRRMRDYDRELLEHLMSNSAMIECEGDDYAE